MNSTSPQKMSQRAGFMMLEVLVITTLSGLVAVTALPGLLDGGENSREEELQRELMRFQQGINRYAREHQGKFPGEAVTADFVESLLLSSNQRGATGPAGTRPLGPYFVGRLPQNPFSPGQGVRIVNDFDQATPDDDPGMAWIYEPHTGRIKPNTTRQGHND